MKNLFSLVSKLGPGRALAFSALVLLAAATNAFGQPPELRPGGSASVLYAFPEDTSRLSVGRNGELTFSLEIPGFPSYLSHRVTPTYNSRGSDGVMGVGWSLATPALSLNVREDRDLLTTPAVDGAETIDGVSYVRNRWISNQLGALTCEDKGGGGLAALECFAAAHAPQKFLPAGDDYAESWRAIDPYEGVTQYFGETDATRIRTEEGRVVSWLLSREATAQGNEVRYFYEERKGSDQRLLRAILVGGNKALRFNYTARRENVTTSYALSTRRRSEWLLTEIELLPNCTPEQIIAAEYDVHTSFRKCPKDAIERIALTYAAPESRFTRRYVLKSWQHFSGDGGIAFAPVQFHYNGDGAPSIGTGGATSTLVSAETPDFQIPVGSNAMTANAAGPFETYADWNRDGAADWISTKDDVKAVWPDPDKTEHRLHVQLRNTGAFDPPVSYREPLSRYAAWIDLGETDAFGWDQDDVHLVGHWDGTHAGAYADLDRPRVLVADGEALVRLISNPSGGSPEAEIGLWTTPWIRNVRKSRPAIFSSISMTVECERFGETECDRIVESVQDVWGLGVDREFDRLGLKLTDLVDFDGDGHLDRVLSGLLVIWDPDAPDADDFGRRNPFTGPPVIYVSSFDPDLDDFKPFERFEIAPPTGAFQNLSPALLSALGVNLARNGTVSPGDMGKLTAPQALITGLGLGIQIHQFVDNFRASTAATDFSGGFALGLTAASTIARVAKAPPELTSAIAFAQTAYSLASGTATAIQSLQSASSVSSYLQAASSETAARAGVSGLDAAAGYASAASAITGVAATITNFAIARHAEHRMEENGVIPAAVASNAKTAAAVVGVVSGAVSAGALVVAIASSAGGPVGWVVSAIAVTTALVSAAVPLFTKEDAFLTANGLVKVDYRPERGVTYRRNGSVRDHFSSQNDLIDWLDIDANGALDLVASRYDKDRPGEMAVSLGHPTRARAQSTKPWRSWAFSGLAGPEFLRSNDIRTTYHTGDAHKADLITAETSLIDMNGDGLLDLVEGRDGLTTRFEDGLIVHPNTGSGFGAPVTFTIGSAAPAGCELAPARISRTRALNWTEFASSTTGFSTSFANTFQQLGPDLDRNGLPDLVVKAEQTYPTSGGSGPCVLNASGRMCQAQLPVDTEPEPSGANTCQDVDMVWFANLDGGRSDGFNEADSHLTPQAHDLFSPDQLATHYVAFNTGAGFTEFVEIAQPLPSFGGSFAFRSVSETETGAPNIAVSGVSNAIVDQRSDGVARLVALDVSDADITDRDGAHAAAHQFALGIPNPDAMNRIVYPEGGVAQFEYARHLEIGAPSGAPMWVLKRATFDDKVRQPLAAAQGWSATLPFLEYHYFGARWRGAAYLGFAGVVERRFDGKNHIEIVQAFNQDGLRRGTVRCTEIRGHVIDNAASVPWGAGAETTICTANEPLTDGAGLDLPLAASLRDGDPVESCLPAANARFGATLLPLLRRVEHSYDTGSSLVRDGSSDPADEIRRVALLQSSRTSTFNGAADAAWREIEVDYDPFPYLTPTRSVSRTSDDLERTLISTWRHVDDPQDDMGWRFLKTGESRLTADGAELRKTIHQRDAAAPYTLRRTTEIAGDDARWVAYEDHDQNGRATVVRTPAGVARYEYYDDFEAGAGLLKSAARDGDAFQRRGGRERYVYDLRGRLIRHENALGGLNRRRYDALGGLLSESLVDGGSRAYQYHDVGVIDVARDAATLGATQRTVRNAQIDGQQISHTTWWDGFLRPYRTGVRIEGSQAVDLDFDADGKIDQTVSYEGDRAWFQDRGATYLLSDTYFDGPGGAQCQSTNYLDGRAPDGFWTELKDALGRRVLNRDSSGVSVENRYSVDADGRERREIDSAGTVLLTATMDALGRSIDIDRAGLSGERLVYDDWDALRRETDRTGRTRVFETNPWGQVTAHCTGDAADLPGVDCPAGQPRVENRYDATGRVTLVIDELGHETTLEHSACGGLGRVGAPAEDGSSGSVTVSRSFDPACNVIEQVSGNGALERMTYDAAGRPASKSIVGANGKVLGTARWSYDPLGRLRSASDYKGRRSYHFAEFRGYTAEIREGRNSVASFHYGLRGELRETRTAEDRATRYRHDLANRVVAIERDRQICDLNALNAGSFATVDVPVEERFDYDRRGRLVRRIDPLGAAYGFEHTRLGELSRSLPPRLDAPALTDGSAGTAYAYDAARRLVQIEFPDQTGRAFAYDGRGNLVESAELARDGGRLSTRYTHDALGRVTTMSPPLDLGKSSCTISGDPAAAQVAYEYTPAGQIRRETGPADANGARPVVETRYSREGFPVEILSEIGARQSYEYDVFGRLAAARSAAGPTARWEYDANSRITAATDHRGGTTRYRYDVRGRMVGVTDPRGFTTRQTYDRDDLVTSVGRQVDSVTEWQGRRWSLDGEGRTASIARAHYSGSRAPRFNDWSVAAQSQVCADRAGRPQAEAAPNGRLRRYGYDARNRLTNVFERSAGAGVSWAPTLEIAYDAMDRRTRADRFLGGGRKDTRRYSYDAFGRPQTIRANQSRVVTTFQYDQADNLCRIEETGRRRNTRSVAFQRTLGGQILEANYSDGARLRKVFDARGLVERVEDETGTWSFDYDSHGRLTRQVQRIDALDRAFTTSIAYTPEGDIAAIDYPTLPGGLASARLEIERAPRSGETTAQLWNGAPFLDALTYDGLGRARAWSIAGALDTSVDYSNDGFLERRATTGGGATLQDLRFQFDLSGNLLALTDGVDPDFSATLGYDNRDRIRSETIAATNGQRIYEWSAADTPTREVGPNGVVTDFISDRVGRLQRMERGATNARVRYDAFGQRTADASRAVRLDYAARGMPTTLREGRSSSTFDYAYDGRRVRADNRHFVYGFDGKPILEVTSDADGEITGGVYTLFKGIELATTVDAVSGETRRFLTDQNASVVAETDAAGGLIAERSFTAFGREIPRRDRVSGDFSTDYAFHGAPRLPDGALHLMGHRVYDAGTLQFLSPDPLASVTEEPHYGFAYANPHLYADRNGLRPSQQNHYFDPDLGMIMPMGIAEVVVVRPPRPSLAEYQRAYFAGIAEGATNYFSTKATSAANAIANAPGAAVAAWEASPPGLWASAVGSFGDATIAWTAGDRGAMRRAIDESNATLDKIPGALANSYYTITIGAPAAMVRGTVEGAVDTIDKAGGNVAAMAHVPYSIVTGAPAGEVRRAARMQAETTLEVAPELVAAVGGRLALEGGKKLLATGRGAAAATPAAPSPSPKIEMPPPPSPGARPALDAPAPPRVRAKPSGPASAPAQRSELDLSSTTVATEPVIRRAKQYARANDSDEYFDVFAHGNRNRVRVGQKLDDAISNPGGRPITFAPGMRLDAEGLATIIRGHPMWRPGMPVRLFACSTGAGGRCLAQSLADHLDVEVLAPSGSLGFSRRPSGFFAPVINWRFAPLTTFKPNP